MPGFYAVTEQAMQSDQGRKKNPAAIPLLTHTNPNVTDRGAKCDLGSGENTEKKFGLVGGKQFTRFRAMAGEQGRPIGIMSRISTSVRGEKASGGA